MLSRSSLLLILPLSLLSACSTPPNLGAAGAKTVATGAAGGATSVGANSQLEHCDRSLGTLAIVEESNQPWVSQLTAQYRTQSTVPLLRMIIQQSNCFAIVERGQAMRQMRGERELMEAGELRNVTSKSGKIGKGQMVAADYTMTPSITFSQAGTSGMNGLLGGRIGAVASLIGGGVKSNEASTMLLLTDNRSGIQLSAAEGSARNWDMGFMAGFFQHGLAGASGFSNTPEGKVLAASFMDSYNQMVKAVRAYKPQSVEGGLGNGGMLRTN